MPTVWEKNPPSKSTIPTSLVILCYSAARFILHGPPCCKQKPQCTKFAGTVVSHLSETREQLRYRTTPKRNSTQNLTFVPNSRRALVPTAAPDLPGHASAGGSACCPGTARGHRQGCGGRPGGGGDLLKSFGQMTSATLQGALILNDHILEQK